MTKPLCSMVYSQEGSEFIGIYATSYTSTETRIPDSRGFCGVSVHSYGFRLLLPERKHAKNSRFCRVPMRRSTSSHQENLAFHGVFCDRVASSLVFAVLRTRRKRQSLPMELVLCGFGV